MQLLSPEKIQNLRQKELNTAPDTIATIALIVSLSKNLYNVLFYNHGENIDTSF